MSNESTANAGVSQSRPSQMNEGGTATMEPRAQFGTGIRAIERPLASQPSSPAYRPTQEYSGLTQEWCLRFRKGHMGVQEIHSRLRACLAKANIDVPQQDTQIIANTVNASASADVTNDDGSLAYQSWRTAAEPDDLWLLVRHVEQRPINP